VTSVCCLCYVGGEVGRDGSHSQGGRQTERAYADDIDFNATPMALQYKVMEGDMGDIIARSRLGHILA
jgi:hypothetical protein